MSRKPHESGSDLIAEAVADLDVEIVVNVQGDEPFVQKQPLEKLLALFEGEEGRQVRVGSLVQVLKDQKLIEDPNYVKVALDKKNNAGLSARDLAAQIKDPALNHALGLEP